MKFVNRPQWTPINKFHNAEGGVWVSSYKIRKTSIQNALRGVGKLPVTEQTNEFIRYLKRRSSSISQW